MECINGQQLIIYLLLMFDAVKFLIFYHGFCVNYKYCIGMCKYLTTQNTRVDYRRVCVQGA